MPQITRRVMIGAAISPAISGRFSLLAAQDPASANWQTKYSSAVGSVMTREMVRLALAARSRTWKASDVRSAALSAEVFFAHLDQIGALDAISAGIRKGRLLDHPMNEDQLRELSEQAMRAGVPIDGDRFVADAMGKQAKLRGRVEAVFAREGVPGFCRRTVDTLNALAIEVENGQIAAGKGCGARVSTVAFWVVRADAGAEVPAGTSWEDFCLALDLTIDYMWFVALGCPALAPELAVIDGVATVISWIIC